MNRNLERATMYVFYCILDPEDFSFESFRDVSVKIQKLRRLGRQKLNVELEDLKIFKLGNLNDKIGKFEIA